MNFFFLTNKLLQLKHNLLERFKSIGVLKNLDDKRFIIENF